MHNVLVWKLYTFIKAQLQIIKKYDYFYQRAKLFLYDLPKAYDRDS